MVPLHIHLVDKSLWRHVYWNPTLFHNINIYLLTNDAQELTICNFDFNPDTNRIFLSILKFEPGSLGQMTDPLANSALPPLLWVGIGTLILQSGMQVY
jgi:hypothetical protein